MEYRDLIGVPFADGGRDARTGLDCWGLALEMFRRQGIHIKDYKISAVETVEIADKMGIDKTDWAKIPEPKIGCLVLIRLSPNVWANHVGVYLGGGHFIHAYSATGVCIDRIKRWRSRIIGYYVPKGGGKH